MKRCAWCGRFVSAKTEPLTFPNAYGNPFTKMLCPDDYPIAIALGEQNLANLARRRVGA